MPARRSLPSRKAWINEGGRGPIKLAHDFLQMPADFFLWEIKYLEYFEQNDLDLQRIIRLYNEYSQPLTLVFRHRACEKKLNQRMTN